MILLACHGILTISGNSFKIGSLNDQEPAFAVLLSFVTAVVATGFSMACGFFGNLYPLLF